MNSVFNKNNVDYLKQPMFLGDNLSLQRYDRFKYPKFFEIWKKQIEAFWRPEEVSLGKDRSDYESLTETERFIFNQNLRWQSLTDSLLNRSINALGQYVSNPELELCMNVWQFFECSIHSYSYTHILQNITKEPGKFFDSILDDKEIVSRANEISTSYDKFFGPSKDIKTDIFDALLATQIAEGLSFYISFACSFFFGYRGKMEGNTKIISLIMKDECYAEGTEVLTESGWKEFKNLSPNEKIAQYNKDKTVEFVVPKTLISYEVDEELVHFCGEDRQYLELLVTRNHRMIQRIQKTDEIEVSYAEQTITNCSKSFIASGKVKGTIHELTDFDRFLIAFQADGSFDDGKRNGRYTGCIPASFNLTKSRKIDRMRKLVKMNGFDCYESVPDENGAITFRIMVPLSQKLSKIFDWVELKDKSSIWCQEFLKEVAHWDGHLRNGDYSNIYYSSVVPFNADVIQAISALSGWRCHRGLQVDNRKVTYNDVHRLTILSDKDFYSSGPIKKTLVPYKGRVYCATVNSGMLIVRYNKKVSVCGNCYHVAITQNIFKYWKENRDEGFQEILKANEQKVYDAYGLAVQNELKWAAYLFSQGSLLGLNFDVMKGYIEWLANNRLTSLGYKKIFDAKINPIAGWFDSFMDSSKIQVAPQESEVGRYKIGGRNTELKDKDFSNIFL